MEWEGFKIKRLFMMYYLTGIALLLCLTLSHIASLAPVDSMQDCKFPFLHSVYHVSLTSFICYSPIDGPDTVAQELSMMRNMHLAIKHERFKDAGKDCIIYLIFYTFVGIMVIIVAFCKLENPKLCSFNLSSFVEFCSYMERQT